MDNVITEAQKTIEKIIDNVEQIIIGKRQTVELAVMTVISQGHLLVADPPGVGKTMLARSLAKSIDCTFKRIQFTPDMLPGDVTGVSVYNQKTADFEYRPGPVMSNIILADEINRANPRVQSALLECMGEKQVSVDGTTYNIPAPFHVLATENPVEYESTFPLPETQLDRFLMSINIGYPSAPSEVDILDKQQFTHPIENLEPVTTAEEVISIQKIVSQIHADTTIKEYIVAITGATRDHSSLYLGASPRGSLALFRASQAHALMENRDYVLPDDVKALVVPVLSHRIKPITSSNTRSGDAKAILSEILQTVPIPGVPHDRQRA
ncbi:MAG: MoxR family ATPase [Dehalococcoidales bacterium]|nr:MAG: MoxR family ATPase [Dehalococcoidales bacterium]